MSKSLREEMVEIIRSGKTAMHKGKPYHSVSELPSEAELAKGDTKASEAALARVKESIESLKKEQERLEAGLAETKKTAKEEAKGSDEEDKKEAAAEKKEAAADKREAAREDAKGSAKK